MPTKSYFLIVILVVVGLLASFYSGFFIKNLLSNSQNSNNQKVILSPYQKYKPIFIDEVIVVSKTKPYKTLVLSAIRSYKDTKYTNYTVKAFYFDGNKWTKQISEGETTESETIPETPYITKWIINSDPSYMLKQNTSGEVLLDNNKIEFNAPLLQNEMGIRSDPKYTKFMSEADGTMTINGTKSDSHILYSRVYSFNAPESLITTSDPSGIETEWLAFWDDNGNFYSIDETKIDNKKTLDVYKAHSMAVTKDTKGNIQKTFSLNLIKNKLDKYKVSLKNTINKSISITRINTVNKSVNGKDIWNTGQATGEVTLENGNIVKGFGIFEQISQ